MNHLPRGIGTDKSNDGVAAPSLLERGGGLSWLVERLGSLFRQDGEPWTNLRTDGGDGVQLAQGGLVGAAKIPGPPTL